MSLYCPNLKPLVLKCKKKKKKKQKKEDNNRSFPLHWKKKWRKTPKTDYYFSLTLSVKSCQTHQVSMRAADPVDSWGQLVLSAAVHSVCVKDGVEQDSREDCAHAG